jgi:hypothetical protein
MEMILPWGLATIFVSVTRIWNGQQAVQAEECQALVAFLQQLE